MPHLRSPVSETWVKQSRPTAGACCPLAAFLPQGREYPPHVKSALFPIAILIYIDLQAIVSGGFILEKFLANTLEFLY